MERTWDEEKTVEVERTLQFSQSQDDTEETKAGAGQERKEDIGSNSAKLTTSTTHEIARRKLSKSRNSRAVSASNLQVRVVGIRRSLANKRSLLRKSVDSFPSWLFTKGALLFRFPVNIYM